MNKEKHLETYYLEAIDRGWISELLYSKMFADKYVGSLTYNISFHLPYFLVDNTRSFDGYFKANEEAVLYTGIYLQRFFT